MTAPQNSFQPKLEQLEKQLSTCSSIPEAILKLIEIKNILTHIDIQQVYSIKDLLIKHLKPLSKDPTNMNPREVEQQKQQLEDFLLVIVSLYANSARYRFEVLAFQLMGELLERNSFLFKLQSSWDDEVTEVGHQGKNSVKFNWANKKNPNFETNTDLYYNCINKAMQILEGVETQINVSGMNFIKEYINFIFKFSSSIKENQISNTLEKIVFALQNNFLNSTFSKDIPKQFSAESIRGVSDAGVKLANVVHKNQLKNRFQMLCSMYGLALLGATSIEKKLNGLKIINKESQQIYRSCSSFIKQQQYVSWLFDNKVIGLIFEQSFQSPILKQCTYIFRIAFKRRCLNDENMQKVFDFIESTNTQNRQTVLRYLQLESIRLNYNDYEMLIRRLQTTHKPDFYEEDFFLICGQCIRYSTQNILRQFVDALGQILKNNFRKFRNERIEQRCIKCYVKAIIRLLEKDNDLETKKNSIQIIYDSYFSEGITQLGLLVFKNIFQELPEISEISKPKAAGFLISQKNIIQKGIETIKKSEDKALNQDIQQFLCLVLKHAADSFGSQKIEFSSSIILEAISSTKMFDKIVSIIQYNNKQLQTSFEQLLNRFQVETIPFQCIKSLFFRINYIYVRQIKEFNQEHYFEVLGKVASLKGYESLIYLLLHATNSQNRTHIAQFIADLYTSFPESRTSQAETQLQLFLNQTLSFTIQQGRTQDCQLRLLGYLALVQNLMMNTQYLGTGKYKPHNSLVPISTVQVSIMNDLTFGNDVAQSYWKKVSSNMTLFDLLTELSQKFRCSVCQISLQEGQKYWPQKWNGLTLEQTKINEKVLKAVKSSKQKIRKQKLMELGQMTPKAKKVFQQIYNTFAVDGKMGRKQCANFVAGVTKTSSSVHDGRVAQFFREFDTDNDDNITFDDFLRFYKLHCSPERDDIVWKNLHNMRFRKDLKKYDDPIELTNQNLLFRSLLYQSQQFYNILFLNSDSKNKELSQRCKRLLLRLPTYPKTLESAKSDLKLIEKNCFQTEYLLIAIQSKLNSKDQSLQEKLKNKDQFIESGNFMRIYEMMVRIDKMDNATQDERKCLFVSLQILRSLLTVPDLKNSIEASDFLNINLKIEQTYLFLKLAQEAFKNMDIDILEAALALQLTQNSDQINFALQGIFHDEIGIRKICCNYIFVLFLQEKVKIDLFSIQEKPNCQKWFQMLDKICKLKTGIDETNVIKRSLSKAKARTEDIENNQDDPIIYGNLSIIHSLTQKSKIKDDFFKQVTQIAEKVISVRSRRLIYSILANLNTYDAIKYVSHLIENVQPIREVEAKKYYVGLKNLGSTCYMNSILQALFCVKGFQDLVLSLPKQKLELSQVKGKKIYDDTVYQLNKMYTYLLKSVKKYYNPEEFCLTIKVGNSNDPIDPKVQEDAHEFVSKFLDKLEKSVEKTGKIDIFRELLEGTTVTQVLCKKCSNKINRQEKFSQISLAVQNIKSLEQSFQKYIYPEEIEDYFCSSCNSKVEKIEKSTCLSKLPKLLMINLQRIIYDLEDLIFKKIDTSFSFPENLNVSNFVLKQSNLTSEDCEFKLKAVIVHSGTSEAGHYYSIIRIDNDWYKFNDQTVTKIQFNNIQHECFGGSESKEQWANDLKFSTNAYMLFYEKKNTQYVELPSEIGSSLELQIRKQNEKFYHQLQVHQQSIYQFCGQIFGRFQPSDLDQRIRISNHEQNWMEDPNVNYYQAIYQFIIRLFKFSTVFYDVKTQYMFQIGQIMFKLFYLLPERSYEFLVQLNVDECIDTLCLHNDETVRNIYKHLLNKSMHVFLNYYQANFQTEEEGVVSLLKIVDSLFAFFEDQRLMKNITKSGHYFDFWRTCCEFIPQFNQYLIQHDALPILARLLVANQNMSAQMRKKRIQLPSSCIPPVIGTIGFLMSRKKNMKSYLNPNKSYPGAKCYQLTESQKAIFGNAKFYEKLMSMKCESSQLGLISSRICEKDLQFSKAMVPIFLRGLNNITNPQSAIGILNYLNFYLSLDDEYSELRFKWILGISQLLPGDDLVYGLSYEDESVAFQYISPLYFMKSEKQDYKTALTTLYENHSTYNSFSIQGVMLLLNLMCNSNKMFSYVLKLPAPTYIHRCYLDWIEKYIRNFKDSYFMEDRLADKINLITKMNQMYSYLAERIQKQGWDIPVNKNIIGRNKELFAVESTYNEGYKMTLWAHLSYVIPNLPLKDENLSLPKQLFKFGNPSGYGKFFISKGKSDLPENNGEIRTELTTYTLQIESKKTLNLKFKFEGFKEQICVHKGKVFVNFPYEQLNGALSTMIEIVEEKEEEQRLQKLENTGQKMLSQGMDTIEKQLYAYPDYSCKICTYINGPDQRMCEMCGAVLN